jgi:sugar O-acyltransferase (sialic acid O-acetyltransferase NeuD family)
MSTAKPSLILIGAGGHAASCIEIIESQGAYKIEGLIGSSSERGARRFGYQVIGCDHDLANYVSDIPFALVAIGSIRSPRKRIRMIERVCEIGFQLPTVIASTAYVSQHAVIGLGSIIMHGVVVNSGADVGANCIINTNSLIEHEVTIRKFSHVSTSVVINGGATVGSASFIGSGCIIRDGVTIGDNCFIGMGQKVWSDLPDQQRLVER